MKGVLTTFMKNISKGIRFVLSAALVLSIGASDSAPTTHAAQSDTVEVSKPVHMLVPIGKTAGIKLFADGVLIVGLSEVAENGVDKSPARDAGLLSGDMVTSIDGKKITSTQELKTVLQQTKGEVKLMYTRQGSKSTCVITPARSDADDTLKLGAWVRDSMAGIGTLTYFDPQNNTFGALGHGINDVDTGALMPLSTGTLVPSVVSAVRKGTAGTPGELSGSFDLDGEYGSLYANTERGIFGRSTAEEIGIDLPAALPTASKNEIVVGAATILTNVEGGNIAEYDIEIKKIFADGAKSPRDMTIEVTDPRLIAITGGIVQGMSGSPIIQNGRIVGAVTHVLINEPTRGYAIFIENMIAQSVEMLQNAA